MLLNGDAPTVFKQTHKHTKKLQNWPKMAIIGGPIEASQDDRKNMTNLNLGR